MKNIYLLLLLSLTMGCSKKENDPLPVKKISITYDFNTNKAGSFQIGYVDSTNVPVCVSFSGTHWTKSITINGQSEIQKIMFAVTATNHDYVALADAKIIVDDKTNATYTYSFDRGQANFEFYGVPWQ